MDIVVAAGADRPKNPDDLERLKQTIEMKNTLYGETFFSVHEYKPMFPFGESTLVQECLESILRNETSPLGKETGFSVDRIVVVCDRELVENHIYIPDNRVSFIQQRGSLYENLQTGFASLFEDGRTLPDPGKGLYFLQRHALSKLHLQHRNLFEFYAALAARDGASIGEHMDAIEAVQSNLKGRSSLAKKFDISRSQLFTLLMERDFLKEKDGKVQFTSREARAYFVDYGVRLEKEVILLGGDTPFYDPGLAYFMHEVSNMPSDVDGALQLVASDSLEPLIGKGFIGRRPYFHMEYLVRTANAHYLKPNKVGNLAASKDQYKNIRWLSAGNALRSLVNLCYNREEGFYGGNLKMGVAALYNHHVHMRLMGLLSRYVAPPSFIREAYFSLRDAMDVGGLEEGLSTIFKSNMRLVINPFPGVSLDVDSKEPDLRMLHEYREAIRKSQADLEQTYLQDHIPGVEEYRSHLSSLDAKMQVDMMLWGPNDFSRLLYSNKRKLGRGLHELNLHEL
ncbi:hypothetical protein H6504_02945 [Candidatus Woesearchaeota archaeon]|nr:hypothetical protein [Candidatus Woesearchaeota archaeon]